MWLLFGGIRISPSGVVPVEVPAASNCYCEDQPVHERLVTYHFQDIVVNEKRPTIAHLGREKQVFFKRFKRAARNVSKVHCKDSRMGLFQGARNPMWISAFFVWPIPAFLCREIESIAGLAAISTQDSLAELTDLGALFLRFSAPWFWLLPDTGSSESLKGSSRCLTSWKSGDFISRDFFSGPVFSVAGIVLAFLSLDATWAFSSVISHYKPEIVSINLAHCKSTISFHEFNKAYSLLTLTEKSR